MLDLLFPPKQRGSADWSGDGFFGFGSFWGGPTRTQANVEVSPELALTYSACWRCTQIISSSVGGCPLITYYHLPGGNKEEARDQRLYGILRDAPNPDMDAMIFREGRTVHQLNFGSGFAEIERTRKGEIAALWPIHPARVRPVRRDERDAETGKPLLPTYRYHVRNNDGSEVFMRADEMLHIPGSHSDDGIWGKGVVAHARESIGLGLATERHGATFFGSGARPTAAVFLPGMKDPEARKNYRQEWRQVHGSPDAGEIAIFPVDGKFEQLSYSPEDSQFLGTRVHNTREIARWYGVPSHLLGDLEKASYNSIEQLGIDFVTFSLLQWLKRWEGQIQLKLLAAEQRKRMFVQHDISAMIYGDTISRYNAYSIGLTKGFLSINDVRRLLNLNSIGALGDKYRVELNTTTLEMAGLPAPARSVSVDGTPPRGAAAQPTAAPTSGQEPTALLKVPNVRQKHNFDCGAASTKAVAMYFGVDAGRDEEDYIQELGTKQTGPMNEDGTHPSAIIDWFTEQGLTVTSGGGWTLDDLRHYWSAGQPVIVPIQDYGTPEEFRENESGHYVVVVGMWGGMVFVQDPSAANAEAGGRDLEPDSVQAFGVLPIEEDVFLGVWHDMEGGAGDEAKVDVCYGIAVGRGHAPPPPADVPAVAPAEPEPDEPQPSPTVADSDSRDRGTTTETTTAARVVLTDTLQRLFRIEANECRRAMDRPDFGAWLAEFHARHRTTVQQALTPLMQLLHLAGYPAYLAASNLTENVIYRSWDVLIEAFGGDTKAQFVERLAAWADTESRIRVEASLPEQPR